MAGGNDAEVKVGITGDASGLGVAIKEAETTLKGFGSKVREVMNSQSASVFKGMLSYEVFKQGVQKATQLISESIKEATQDIQDQQKVIGALASVGLAWEDVGDKVQEFDMKMKNLGVDDADVALGTLTQTLQGDLTRALDMTKLASDLASSGFGTFQDNVDNLQKVLTGKGAKALMQYGIALEDNATITEQISAIQGRATITTEMFANSVTGAMNRVNLAQKEIKIAFGKGILLAFDDALQKAGLLSGGLASNEEQMKVLTKVAFQLANALIAVGSAVKLAVDGISGVVKGVKATVQVGLEAGVKKVEQYSRALEMLGVPVENITNELDLMGNGLDQLSKENFDAMIDKGDDASKTMEVFNNAIKNVSGEGFDELFTKFEKNETELAKLKGGTKALTAEQIQAQEESKKARDEASKSFSEMRDKILNARDSVNELASSIKDKLTESFKNFTDTMKSDITDAKSSLAEIVIGAETDLIDLQKQLSEEQSKSGESSSADRIAQLRKEIDEKKKIISESATFESDLKKKIDEAQAKADAVKAKQLTETDPIALAKLQTELEARNLSIESLKSFGDLDKTIAEERRLASLDEFTRFEEETFKRIELKTEEFVTEVTQLREKQAVAESVEKAITEFYASQTSVRQATLDAFAVSSIATLQRIGSEARSALSALQAFQSQSARAGATTTGSGKAMGGYVGGGEMVHGGEYVIPRWLVQRLPSLVGQLESMRSGSGGSSKTVNAPITINANVRDGVDIRSIGSEMGWELGKL